MGGCKCKDVYGEELGYIGSMIKLAHHTLSVIRRDEEGNN